MGSKRYRWLRAYRENRRLLWWDSRNLSLWCCRCRAVRGISRFSSCLWTAILRLCCWLCFPRGRGRSKMANLHDWWPCILCHRPSISQAEGLQGSILQLPSTCILFLLSSSSGWVPSVKANWLLWAIYNPPEKCHLFWYSRPSNAANFPWTAICIPHFRSYNFSARVPPKLVFLS